MFALANYGLLKAFTCLKTENYGKKLSPHIRT